MTNPSDEHNEGSGVSLTASEPVRKPRRRNRTAKEWHPKFLVALANSGVIRAACLAVDIERQTVYDHMEKYPEFKADVDQALKSSIELLEASARTRALQGSDMLLKFLLERLKPEVYRETIRVDIRQLLIAAAERQNLNPEDVLAAAEMLNRMIEQDPDLRLPAKSAGNDVIDLIKEQEKVKDGN